MKPFLIGLFAVAFLAAAASAEATTEKVIYSFCSSTNCSFGSTDGTLPEAGLIEKKGKLYGTTFAGDGTESYCGVGGSNGCGTVFSIDPSTGVETILHAFVGENGEHPNAGLTAVNGTFYGTTVWGGKGVCANGCGTLFSIDPATGTEKVLHSFQPSKAENPGGLINVQGILYGTTSSGGIGRACYDGCGTVFSFDLSSSTFAVVQQLHLKTTGGQTEARLLNLEGKLYGTTPRGSTYGYGAVFSVSPATGHMTSRYAFGESAGPSPLANLIDVNGTLYGTTTRGNGSCCGAIFSIDPKTGTVEWLHTFCGQSCSDGANPVASLINVEGILYGTTTFGGTGTCSASDGVGCGTVFSFDLTTGTYSVLYSFQNDGTDGSHPWAPLLDVNGTLYGTTLTGGGSGCGGFGCGTVFSITP